VFRIQWADGHGHTKHLRLQHAPYILEGLPAGAYTIAALIGSDFPPPGREPFRTSIEIPRGEQDAGAVECVLERH